MLQQVVENAIFIIIFYNTPVSVARVRKILKFVGSCVNSYGFTYCESVFRKSFVENVEVF